ncbi:MAG TPA: hypothetical protein VHF26_11285 [Trebonia sp.]|jgi:hypothetical protein|nr:hypothetical protein [Trebonia sp.]
MASATSSASSALMWSLNATRAAITIWSGPRRRVRRSSSVSTPGVRPISSVIAEISSGEAERPIR